MAAPRRIVLLGAAGAGKTTFARRLGAAIGAPVVVLDEIWPPGTQQDVAAFRETIAARHAGDAWVSDGNFAAATFDLRLPRADMIIWLDRPRWLSTWRSFRRVFARGEAHTLAGLPRALQFIWNFDKINRPRIEGLRLQHGPHVPVLHLHNDSEIAAFLKSI